MCEQMGCFVVVHRCRITTRCHIGGVKWALIEGVGCGLCERQAGRKAESQHEREHDGSVW